MKPNQTLQDFYQIPENNRIQPGDLNIVENFNVFKRWNCSVVKTYLRRDFYRIILIIGTGILRYGDKIVEINKPSIVLANKMIPYSWDPVSEHQSGWVCLFSSDFINTASHYTKEQIFPLLNSDEIPVYPLDEKQQDEFSGLFENIAKEFNSDYLYKFNLLQNYLLVLIHEIQKLESKTYFSNQIVDAAHRTTYRFLELLEQQFPIQSPQEPLQLRSPKDYANKLYIHVNNLNHSVKKVTGKTSSMIISNRIIAEAKELLKNSDWDIAEISEALGFEYPSHFTNYFRKHTHITPKSIRNNTIV